MKRRIESSVTTPHFHKCQAEPMKKAKNSQGFGKAMIIENLYAKKTYIYIYIFGDFCFRYNEV